MSKRELLTTRTPILLHYQFENDRLYHSNAEEYQADSFKIDKFSTQKSKHVAVAKSLVPKHKATVTEIYYKHVVQTQARVTDVYFYIEPRPGMILQKSWRTLTIDGIRPACIQGNSTLRDKLLSIQRDLDFNREVLTASHHRLESPCAETGKTPRRLDVTMGLLKDFLATTEGPVAGIAKAFSEAISGDRLHPLLRSRTLSTTSSCVLSNLGPRSPGLYSADVCWFTTPCERTLEGMAMANMSRGEVRRRGEAHVISGDQRYRVISEVIRCLHQPDPQGTPYIFNIPMEEGKPYAMRVPEELSIDQGQLWEGNNSLGAVLSPQFSFTDLHIDSGTQVLSTVLGSCVKLWACYPPTGMNLDLMYGTRDAEHKFVTLSPFLSDGFYVITTNEEAIHIPCGWLHAVYTLSGGVLVGINWVSETDITSSEQYFIRESAHEDCSSKDIMAFVYALELASHSVDAERQQRSLETWCRQRNTLRRLAKLKHNKGFKACVRSLEQNMVDLESMLCKHCGQSAHAHSKRVC